MKRTPLTLAVLALAASLAWLLWFWEPVPAPGDQHRPPALAAPPTGGDFRLTAGGETLDLKDLRGQVVLIYFGYTWCPDICPTNLAFIAAALKALTPEELARVQVLFISVDPQRDDPRRLARYAGYFHPRIRGVTGSADQLAAAARRYGAAYRRVEQSDSALGYLVDHSAYTYLVDPRGALVQTLDHATPPPVITAAIRKLLEAG
ncbi:SCO family protein [uncultured Thiodictyon sp.]|jgi:protein SCO1/2|uniref:SCO family protein n=1 Tax=uncultured Thiodictyon sp. TaxID=1846217 RepID=UPI0025D78CF0|nr:SCO family protein [uncultured Thiodictyon sp.]